MIKHIRHTGIVVKDLNRSMDFYRNLGFVITSQEKTVIAGNVLDTCKMVQAIVDPVWITTAIELIQVLEGSYFSHIAVEVDNLDEYSWGVVVHYSPGHRICFIEDPDGNKIELVEEI